MSDSSPVVEAVAAAKAVAPPAPAAAPKSKPHEIRPKKHMHPYLCYVTANVSSDTKMSDTAGSDAGDTAAVKTVTGAGGKMKLIAENWRNLAAEDRKPYEAMAQKDGLRRDKEMKEFNETGYFTNKDGLHSS